MGELTPVVDPNPPTSEQWITDLWTRSLHPGRPSRQSHPGKDLVQRYDITISTAPEQISSDSLVKKKKMLETL